MDYPRQQRRQTWKDSLYFRITVDTLAACAIVVVVVPPVLAAFQVIAGLSPVLRLPFWDVFKTTSQYGLLWGFPYVWMSFLAIEKTRLRFGGDRDTGFDCHV